MLFKLPQREEFLRKKRKRKIIKYSIICGIIVFVIALTSFISHRSSIRISQIELSGGVLVRGEDVETKTLQYLEGSHFWLFPKDNAFWYSKNSLKDFLMENFKRIDSIETNLKNFHTLSIKITERQPIATWCKGSPKDVRTLPSRDEIVASTTTNTLMIEVNNTDLDVAQCWFIDQNSTVFAVSPFFSGDAYFKYYGLITDSDPIGKEYIASTTEFADITRFVESVKKLSLHPQFVVAKGGGEFSLVISGGGELYFDTKKPLSLVSDNLEVLLETPALSRNLSKLDYIDLRYGNKLFYKMKE